MTNSELQSMMPDVRNMMKALDSGEFSEYEKKLCNATNKAIDALEEIIDDNTLKLDPEQTVRAVQVLTKSRIDLLDARRKLAETCIKGEVLIKSLEQPKDQSSSVLLEYLQKNGLDENLDRTGTSPSSIFQSIAENEE